MFVIIQAILVYNLFIIWNVNELTVPENVEIIQGFIIWSLYEMC